MTVIDSNLDTVEPLGDCLLPGEVIDALVDGAAAGTDRVSRAEAVHGIAREIFATVTWRYAENADAEELASLHRVIAAAQAHLDRMRGRQTPSDPPGPPAASYSAGVR